MLLVEIANADPGLFVHFANRLLEKGAKVFVKGLHYSPTSIVQITEVDDNEHPIAVKFARSIEDDLGDKFAWDILDPDKEWTISKIKEGWLIHEVS